MCDSFYNGTIIVGVFTTNKGPFMYDYGIPNTSPTHQATGRSDDRGSDPDVGAST